MSYESNYYLLIYEAATRRLQIEDFGAESAAAASTYSIREREYRDKPDIEVVLVGADSLETVKKTHSHYFATSTESLLLDLESALAL
ncbi:MAG: hypothetical protein ACYDHH_14685 [Solirubrobacteraceae bacterium]